MNINCEWKKILCNVCCLVWGINNGYYVKLEYWYIYEEIVYVLKIKGIGNDRYKILKLNLRIEGVFCYCWLVE